MEKRKAALGGEALCLIRRFFPPFPFRYAPLQRREKTFYHIVAFIFT
jgi:hypothetical protein